MRRLLLPLVAALTLGLAPFAPEPHLVGKLRWVAGGATGMGLVDWLDLAMHGAPWLWLLWAFRGEARARLVERSAGRAHLRWQMWALTAALIAAAACVVVAIVVT